jgi:hypothetical protein
MKYLMKEDKSPFEHGVKIIEWLKEHKEKIVHKGNAAMDILMNGGSLDDIIEEEELRGYALTHKRKIEEMSQYLKTKRWKAEKDWNDAMKLLERENMNEENAAIAAWLSKNVKRPRRFKQAQLWICGAKNIGKTSLIRALRKYLNLYQIPKHNHHEDYVDGVFDMAYIDEYKGEKKLQWWNSWLEGSEFKLDSRYTNTVKNNNLPTIIISNFEPHHLYPAATGLELDTLLCRIIVVKCVSLIDIFPDE